jgi:hypothetical protein
MARRLIWHLWNRSHGTVTRKDLWLWDNGDNTWTVEWRADAHRDTGSRVFGDLEAAQRAVFDWTRQGDWKDIADHGRPTG